jgi:2-(3-amino-3-carboxypropyl)histidine synthase
MTVLNSVEVLKIFSVIKLEAYDASSFPIYEFEVERVIQEIRKHKARRVLIQLPDGLRSRSFKIFKKLRRATNSEIIISGDSCYGSCDLAINQGRILKVDLIVHYGHSKMLDVKEVPVVYVDVSLEFNLNELVNKLESTIKKWSKIGLTSSVQHVRKLGDLSEILKQLGFDVVIGESSDKTLRAGQILGCNFDSAVNVAEKVDGFIFIGAGRFHPLGVAISTGKPVVTANPYTLSVEIIKQQDIMSLAKRRVAAIFKAKEAQKFGVIISIKPGQFVIEKAEIVQSKLVKRGKEAIIICLDEINSEKLLNFSEVETFVCTACPRIAIDGLAGVNKPLLTSIETEIMLGEIKWQDAWGSGYFRN